MALLLLFLFIAVPLIEIALFIEIGGLIGLWPTLAVVVLTAVVGTALVRAQGIAVLAEAQRQADAGEPPVRPLAHGIMILLAGALLLTPGFFTDAVGLALLLPPVRDWLAKTVWRLLQKHGKVHVHRPEGGDGRDGVIIDGEYRDVSDEESAPRGARGKRRGRTPPAPGPPNPDSPWRRDE